MAVTQYIGARYVPIFADPAEWSSTKQYEPLTIVLHNGNSFTSKQFVPVDVDINNTDFWVETGNYNAQIEQYRQDVIRLGRLLPAENFDSENTVTQYIENEIKTSKEYVTPEMYGAIGDGNADDTEAFRTALAQPKPLLIDKQYKIHDTFTLNNKHVFGTGTIFCNDTPFIIMNDVKIEGVTFNGNDFTKLCTIGVKICGLRNIIDNVYFYNYGTAMLFHTLDNSVFAGIAYNCVSNVFAFYCQTVIHGQGANNSWFNENTFMNVNLIQWSNYRAWLQNKLGDNISDSYAFRMDYDNVVKNSINGNKFINCNAEMCAYGGFYICGIKNTFISCRVEGLTVPFYMPPDIVDSEGTHVNGYNYFFGCYEQYPDYKKNYVKRNANDEYIYNNYIFANNAYRLANEYLINTNYQHLRSGFVVNGQNISFIYGEHKMFEFAGIQNPPYITMNTRLNHLASAQYPLSSFSGDTMIEGEMDGEIRYCYTNHKYYYWNNTVWKEFGVV